MKNETCNRISLNTSNFFHQLVDAQFEAFRMKLRKIIQQSASMADGKEPKTCERCVNRIFLKTVSVVKFERAIRKFMPALVLRCFQQSLVGEGNLKIAVPAS